MTSRFEDLTGCVFGELTVLGLAERKRDENGRLPTIKWHCKCSCGNIVDIATSSLTSGRSQSCGHNQGLKKAERLDVRKLIKAQGFKCVCAECNLGRRGLCCEWCNKIDCALRCANTHTRCERNIPITREA